jgi:SNF2 family DNA or RNA helicase
MARLSPFVDIVSKQEAMPWLPPKTHEQRFVDPTPEQKRVMMDLKDLMETEYKGQVLSIETVLERLTRYQQIVGGNYPFEVQDDKGSHYETRPFDVNPKMGALIEVIEEMGQDKVIIWARFKPELRAIAKALEPYGEVVQFHGDIDDEGRKDAVQRFQFGSARFMVSNQAVGGVGQTWTAASKVIYYSNTFSYRDRMQSEDRCHRKGTVNPVLYVDITMNHAIDRLIVASLRNKEGMAMYVKNELMKLQSGR